MHEIPLIFGCPSCGARLSVPPSSAGVVGPCPHCRQIIRAPVPQVPAAVIHPSPGPQTAALVPRIPKPIPAAAHAAQQGSAPYPQTAYPVAAQSFYQSPTGVFHPGQMAGYFPPPPGQGLPPVHGGVPVQGVPQVTYPGPPAASGWIGRSSPTGQTPFPDRKEPISSTSDVAANPVQRPRYAANPIPVRNERRPVLARLLIPLVFVAAALAVVFGLRKALEADQAAAGGLNPSLATEDPQVHAILPEDHIPPKALKPDVNFGTPAVADTRPPPPLEAVPALPDDRVVLPPGVRGLEALEKFLAAGSLEERLPMLETNADEETLAASSLAGKLPPQLNIETDIHVPHRSEDFIDVYYNVDFDDGDGKPNPQTIVVRLRGNQEPKIVADPFLDLFDGRLAGYAAGPSERGGVFHAIISADAFCWDDNIPNKDKKLTLKLMSRGNTREIARAYFSKQSKIGQMLESDLTSELTYGQAKPATVLLGWNIKEDPSLPYLEALDIRAFHWNP